MFDGNDMSATQLYNFDENRSINVAVVARWSTRVNSISNGIKEETTEIEWKQQQD